MGEGDDMPFSWEMFPISLNGHVNPRTLDFSTNLGFTIPFPGSQETFSVNGNFNEGATTAVNLGAAKGSVAFYSKGKELWVKPELSSPCGFFPTMNEEAKIMDLPSSVREKDDTAVLDLSRSTRLQRDVAATGNIVAVGSALPTHGVSLFAGVYSVPRFLWEWRKHRIVKKEIVCRGLQIPDRTKRDYIIPVTVGTVTGTLGAGADSVAGFADGVAPHAANATHELTPSQWLDHAGQAAEKTATSHAEALVNPGFAENLVTDGWAVAYDPDGITEHAENGIEYLASASDTIMPGGAPLLSERTADIAGQTVAAVVIGEAAGKGVEAAAPKRRVIKR